MNTKDGIATWILVLFVLSPCYWAYNNLHEALNLDLPVSTILWWLGITLVVGASALFLIVHFVHVMGDLEHYRAEEKEREKALIEKIADNKQ